MDLVYFFQTVAMLSVYLSVCLSLVAAPGPMMADKSYGFLIDLGGPSVIFLCAKKKKSGSVC